MNTNHKQANNLRVLDPEAFRYEQHRHYAGEIILSDFHTGQSNGRIARKIMQAETIDDICRVNDLLRQKREAFQ